MPLLSHQQVGPYNHCYWFGKGQESAEGVSLHTGEVIQRYIRENQADLLIHFGVRRALVDEELHYVSISLPGCQVQGVTALTICHVGERVVPQQNFHNIPERDRNSSETFSPRFTAHILQQVLNKKLT